MSNLYTRTAVIVFFAILAFFVPSASAQEIEWPNTEITSLLYDGYTNDRRITGSEDFYKFLATDGSEDVIMLIQAESEIEFEVYPLGSDDEVLVTGALSAGDTYVLRESFTHGWYIVKVYGQSESSYTIAADRIAPDAVFAFQMEINIDAEVGSWPNRVWQNLNYLVPENSVIRVEIPAGEGFENWFLYQETATVEDFIAFEIRQLISGDGNKVYLWGDLEDEIHDRDAGLMNLAIIKIMPSQ